MARAADDLKRKASAFAGDVSSLLNHTVTDGIRVTSVLDESTPPPTCYVGYLINSRSPVPFEAIQLLPGRRKTRTFLHVYHVLKWDDEHTYLADQRSAFGLYAGPEMNDSQMVLRYDYDLEIRNNEEDEPYPIAHVHVAGDLNCLRELPGPPDELSKLHIPVGGKRYRPSLEDVIEFAVVEGFAGPRDGWRVALEEHRETWRSRQLGAAVRRDPATAAIQLTQLGWRITPPPAEKDVHEQRRGRE